MEALVTAPGNTAVINTIPIPEPAVNEIRIQVRAVSLNPVDALYTAAPPAPDDPGRVVGSDFAGVVEKVGDNVTQWKIGDRVTGFVQGATAENRRPGGFAEYAILEADLTIRIPSDISFEEASTVPLCALTAAQMLFITLALNAPFNNPAKVTHELKGDSPAILIYSASTSVGIFAIELALIARTPQGKPYRIFATASPKHHEKLLKKGVTAVFDYRDPDWPAKVRQESGGIAAALDCIAEGDSTAKISHSFEDTGGPIATVRGEAWTRDGFKDGVTGIYTTVWVGLGHDLYYRDALYTLAPPAPDDPGRVVGSDFAGVVEKIGANVTQWKVGDRVTGFVQGATAENRRPGGFAEYAILEADLAIRIPSNVSFEEASTVPLCALTAAQMLFITLGLNAPFNNPATVTNKLKGDSPAILIYSAATSVGIFAVDLALIARTPEGKPYRVFATASSKHHEKLLKQGVEAVFDYRDPDWPAKARQVSGGIDAALDCIAEGASTAQVSHSFRDGGGTMATVRREAWTREGVKEGVTGIYSAVWAGLGHELHYYGKYIPASDEWRAFTVEFYNYLSADPHRFPITHITPRIMPDGLHGIVPLAFPLLGEDLVIERNYAGPADYLKPISAEKLVFPLKPQPK
ncbi:hypothetical protein C0991_005656 [Blastosporella zonata]|nr:hypothetical protein C0991_005656 [Blastosporella zonata]